MANERTITVCSACLRACCWHGNFTCEDARGAGLKELTINQLKELDREHSDWWYGRYADEKPWERR
jgi:hypothetical protein